MTTETILTYKEISKTLVDEGILLVPQEITGYDIVIARAIEQAVLQSTEIQALRKDAKRMDYILRNPWRAIDLMREQCSTNPAHWGQEAIDAIDVAMKEQK